MDANYHGCVGAIFFTTGKVSGTAATFASQENYGIGDVTSFDYYDGGRIQIALSKYNGLRVKYFFDATK